MRVPYATLKIWGLSDPSKTLLTLMTPAGTGKGGSKRCQFWLRLTQWFYPIYCLQWMGIYYQRTGLSVQGTDQSRYQRCKPGTALSFLIKGPTHFRPFTHGLWE